MLPSPVATPALDKDDLLEVRAHLDLYGSILHDHTRRLDALPPTLFEGYGQDFTEFFARHSNAQRAALWQARYEDQREIHDLRMQHAIDQRKMQKLRDHVTTLEWRMDRIEEQ
ncbi:hypothetical protein Tco_0827821, partial [Tanacetum coccineum]